MEPLRLTVKLGTPQPGSIALPDLTFDAPTTSIQIQSNVETGFESCSVGHPVRDGGMLRSAYLPSEPAYRPRGHVRIGTGNLTLFEGRLGSPRIHGGRVVGFTAMGYAKALEDDWIDAPVPLSGTGTAAARMGASQMIRALLATYAAHLGIGNGDQFQSLTAPRYALSAFNGSTPGQAVSQIVKAGGDGAPWDFQVWENLTAWFRPRARPATPKYVVPWDEAVDLTFDPEEIVSHVTLGYTRTLTDSSTQADSITYPSLVDTTVSSRFGFTKHRRLDGGTLTTDAAEAFARAYWAERSVRRWSGSITRESGRGLELYRGGEQPRYLVRAGEWVHIEGLPANESPLIITSTDWSSEDDRLTIQVGPGITTEAEQYRELRRTIAALRAERNPITGATTTSTQTAYANAAITDLTTRLEAAEAALAAL